MQAQPRIKTRLIARVSAVAMACSIPLAHLTTQVDTVSWSADNRLAVTTNEAIYILTLKSVMHPTASSKPKPPFIMSIAQLPDTLTSLDVGIFNLPGPYVPRLQPGGLNVAQFLDRTITDQSCDHFKASDWTPPCCSHLGGCLLSCLTTSGKLLLYSAPGYLAARWKLMKNLTEAYSCHLMQCGFEPGSSREHEQEDSNPSMKIPKAEVLAHRKYMVACVTFAWLPTLLPRDGGCEMAVVAMATKSGHIVFYGMEVPLTRKSSPAVTVLRVTELPEARDTGGAVACSLVWHSSEAATLLTLGCTNGTVLNLYWSQLSLTSEPVATTSNLPELRLPPPQVLPLWPHADGMPVHHIAWQRKADGHGSALWLVFNKGCTLLAFHMETPLMHTVTEAHPHPLSSPLPYIMISGRHSMPVSGLCALPDCGFLSSALDGSLQRFSLLNQPPQWSHDESCAGQVTPELVSIETLSTGNICTCQGVAVSHNGIFAAVSINPRSDFSQKKKSYAQLHFLVLVGSTVVEKLKFCSDWDVWEFIRQQSVQEAELPKYVQGFLAAKPRSPSISQLKFQLQMNLISQDSVAAEQCAVAIQQRHMMETLKAWKQWEADHHGCPDQQGLVTLHLVCQGLANSDLSSVDAELIHEVMQALPQDGSTIEFCPVCGAVVPLTSCRQEVCTNGHTWSRCSVTLSLVHATRCRRCILCEAPANTTESFQPGTWLHHLLKRNSKCIYCDGYFEQPV